MTVLKTNKPFPMFENITSGIHFYNKKYHKKLNHFQNDYASVLFVLAFCVH